MTVDPPGAGDSPQRQTRTRPRWLRWTFDIALVVLVVTAISAWQARGHVRGEIPPFSLNTLDGMRLESSSLRGTRTLLVFWAPWCGVCRLESSNISAVQELMGERARVVSIASEYETVHEVEAYVRENGVDYPVLLGGDHTSRRFRVDGFPTLYFLDADGRITRSVTGYSTTFGILWRLMVS